MPITFTPKWVRNITAAGKRAQWADTVRRGLVLRVSPSGKKSYAVIYHKNGRNYRMTLGEPSDDFTLAKAREMAGELLIKVRLGAHPAAEKRQTRESSVLSVGELVTKMLEHVELAPSTRPVWRRLADVDLAPIAKRSAGDLARSDIRLLLAKIAERTVSTAVHAFEVLHRAYAWGLEMELVTASPCAGLKHGYKIRKSDRVLSTPEVRALWRALELLGTSQRPDGIRLLLLTGTRKMMVLGSEEREFEGLHGLEEWRLFEGVTEAEPRWTISGGPENQNRGLKGGDHLVPLSPQAVAIVLRRIQEGKDGYLFPTWNIRRKGQEPSPYMLSFPSKWVLMLKVATRWALWCLQAGEDEVGPRLAPMKRWKLHNLRHTMATHMREDLRVDRNVVALILAHEQTGGGGATHIYDRAELLPERRAALVAWGAWLEAVAAGQPARVLPMRAAKP